MAVPPCNKAVQQMSIYIHQLPDWPNFTWRIEEFVYLLGEARNLQGRLMGKMESLGFDLRSEALLETLTLDVLKSTAVILLGFSAMPTVSATNPPQTQSTLRLAPILKTVNR
jgi:hypothetical protein